MKGHEPVTGDHGSGQETINGEHNRGEGKFFLVSEGLRWGNHGEDSIKVTGKMLYLMREELGRDYNRGEYVGDSGRAGTSAAGKRLVSLVKTGSL